MNEFMILAAQQAREGITKGHGGSFGCVIVKEWRVIGSGHKEVIKNHDPTCHGEIMAIRDACRNTGSEDLSGCELYTTGEPCPMCRGAILWANIRKVYFGCTIADAEEIGFRDNRFYQEFDSFSSIMCESLDRSGCLEVFREYAAIEDKQSY